MFPFKGFNYPRVQTSTFHICRHLRVVELNVRERSTDQPWEIMKHCKRGRQMSWYGFLVLKFNLRLTICLIFTALPRTTGNKDVFITVQEGRVSPNELIYMQKSVRNARQPRKGVVPRSAPRDSSIRVSGRFILFLETYKVRPSQLRYDFIFIKKILKLVKG